MFLQFSLIVVVTGKLCGFVGGTTHVHKLLPPLELLICGEESAVRSMVRLRWHIHCMRSIISYQAANRIAERSFGGGGGGEHERREPVRALLPFPQQAGK